ncbi:hypothetical protein [Segatella asaccharophila]
MIEKIEILQHRKCSNFGRNSYEEAFRLLCIVAYHYKMASQLREDLLYSLSETLVCPERRSSILPVQSVGNFKSCGGCFKEILLFRRTQIPLSPSIIQSWYSHLTSFR